MGCVTSHVSSDPNIIQAPWSRQATLTSLLSGLVMFSPLSAGQGATSLTPGIGAFIVGGASVVRRGGGNEMYTSHGFVRAGLRSSWAIPRARTLISTQHPLCAVRAKGARVSRSTLCCAWVGLHRRQFAKNAGNPLVLSLGMIVEDTNANKDCVLLF